VVTALIVHSSQRCFAARLNSGVGRQISAFTRHYIEILDGPFLAEVESKRKKAKSLWFDNAKLRTKY
jgi:hypothetical protein